MSSRVGSVGPGQGVPAAGDGVAVGSARGVNRPEPTQVDGVSAPPEGQGVDVLARPAAPAGAGAGGPSIVGRLGAASYGDQLMRMAEAALGPSSFGLGVCVGMAKNPIDGVVGLLELQKTFVLADLYDRMSEPLSWKSVLGA